MRTLISRLLIFGLLLAGVIFASLPLLAPRPPEFDLHRVDKGLLRVQVSEEGKTRVKQLFVVSAPIPGLLRRIELDAGSPVEAGKTVIARIQATQPPFHNLREASELRARLAQARAQYDLAKADLERVKAELVFAESELKRNHDLVKQRAVTERDLESAQMEVQIKQAGLVVAENSLKAKAAEVEVARAALISPAGNRDEAGEAVGSGTDSRPTENPPPETQILATANGVLLRKIKESETTVPAGEPLFELGNIDELEIQVEMLSQDAAKVRLGAKATLTDWGEEKPLKAEVKRIEPWGFTKISALGIEDQRVNVILDFDEPQEALKHLGHGYRVNVAIDVWEEEVVRLPIGAMFRSGNRWAVYAVDHQGIVRLQKVEIGHMNDQYAEVRSGVREGSAIILYPSDRIEDGMWVALPPSR